MVALLPSLEDALLTALISTLQWGWLGGLWMGSPGGDPSPSSPR